MRKTVLSFFLDRDHLHRDVPGGGIELEIVQDRPAQHVGKEHVERDRGRLVLSGECQCLLAAIRHDTFEAVIPREFQQDPREVRVIVHDEQHAIAIDDGVAVVRHLFLARDGLDGQHGE